MTAQLSHKPPKTGSLVSESWVLGSRTIVKSLRTPSSIVEAVVVPIVFFLLFNLILRRVMEARGFDYEQLLPPTLVVEALFLSAISSAFFVADDRRSGLITRLRVLPIRRSALLLGRSIGDLGRASLSATIIIGLGLASGLRFERGWSSVFAFIALTILFSFAVSLGMGLIGFIAPTPEGAASIASAPYLPLMMLSSGFAPVEDFPDWLEPFVRYQPVTAIIDALRAVAGTGEVGTKVTIAVAWCVGMSLLFSALAGRALGRVS